MTGQRHEGTHKQGRKIREIHLQSITGAAECVGKCEQGGKRQHLLMFRAGSKNP